MQRATPLFALRAFAALRLCVKLFYFSSIFSQLQRPGNQATPLGACQDAPAAMVVVCSAQMDGKNKLYFGDNLKILRDHVADASVDLIYLDPPFNSNASYNVLFKEKSGEESAAQITVFEDTRESDANS
jgi:hypothetical protein